MSIVKLDAVQRVARSLTAAVSFTLFTMSRLVAKLMLALLMLPTAAVLYMISTFVTVEVLGWSYETLSFSLTGALTLAYIAVYWISLWRQSVTWNSHRLLLTAFCSGVALAIGAVAGAVCGSLMFEASFGLFVGTVVTALSWLFATVLVWRETNAERAQRLQAAGATTVMCINCGYNLTGLKHTTCPECGAQPTIEELLAAQDVHAEKELNAAE